MSGRNYTEATLHNARAIYLALAGDRRLTKVELIDETGLTPGQFGLAKEALTHALQVHVGQPLGYDPEDWCYFLPGTLDEARPWMKNRLSDTRTRLVTQRQTLLASAQAFPEHGNDLRWWEHQLGRLEDDLARVLAELAG